MTPQLQQKAESYRQRLEQQLQQRLNGESRPPAPTLSAAMQYATLNGGKRIRGLLVYLTGELFQTPLPQLDPVAAAIEMVHAYSLIHDDLPAMDDDDIRRGRPACHIQFGEAVAILAGDALQTLAFSQLSGDQALQRQPDRALQLIATLAHASGEYGMVGGQMLDMEAEQRRVSLSQLQQIHHHKTGALIHAAIAMAATLSAATAQQRQRLADYSRAIGLAFQVRDDILDATADSDTLGKPVGSDAAAQKSTYPALLGLDAAYSELKALQQQAHQALQGFDHHAAPLRDLADYIAQRPY
ncbi:geranyl transferase [Ectothiorhodospiraceae bacterium BW-2]|nr:geranyl transferase [Ectothiorhodospiraceae bacterium BW-2]